MTGGIPLYYRCLPLTCLVTRPLNFIPNHIYNPLGRGQKQLTCQGEGAALKKNGHFIQYRASQGHAGVLTTRKLDQQSGLTAKWSHQDGCHKLLGFRNETMQ